MPSNKATLRLDWVTAKAATFACKNWHYSKTLPAGKNAYIGVWEDDIFIGVIIYGSGASAQAHKSYGLEFNEYAELFRIALRSHTNHVSRMISISIKIIRKAFPGLRLLASFADSNQGHVGGIYKASNWIYTGNSSQVTEYFYSGKWYHVTVIYKKVGAATVAKLPSRKKPSKYRYLFPLDSSMTDVVLSMQLPYPKKGG